MGKYGEPWVKRGFKVWEAAHGSKASRGRVAEVTLAWRGSAECDALAQRITDCGNFCAGYTLPDDVTLGDLLTRIRELRQTIVYVHGEDWDTIKNTDELLAKFEKED